ncbi:MAG: hypothetical protein CMF99_06285 [Candidatus Marinimicrobia bacterium]|nr:hypothetical protein [Candidatus Neomarinimicrobiota bacterium]|tara:strand:+ start:5043 stop:5795 length:753 start_codon:yes stop_codon:yes gene_type:complete
MTFEKKTSEYVLTSTFSNFKINSCKALINRLSKRSSKELINKLMIKENKTSFLQKYKTTELIDLITTANNKERNKNEHIISIVSILAQRYKTFQSMIKKYPKQTPAKIIDDVLFHSKVITSVAGTNIFTIVNWKQLSIEIKDKEPNCIFFKKVINGIPSDHKIIEKKLDDLHLGLATRTILETFGYLGLEESYNHPLKKKDQVFRLNKALKELFRIPSRNNPFFWKQNKLFTNITITAYDINNVPVLPLE